MKQVLRYPRGLIAVEYIAIIVGKILENKIRIGIGHGEADLFVELPGVSEFQPIATGRTGILEKCSSGCCHQFERDQFILDINVEQRNFEAIIICQRLDADFVVGRFLGFEGLIEPAAKRVGEFGGGRRFEGLGDGRIEVCVFIMLNTDSRRRTDLLEINLAGIVSIG